MKDSTLESRLDSTAGQLIKGKLSAALKKKAARQLSQLRLLNYCLPVLDCAALLSDLSGKIMNWSLVQVRVVYGINPCTARQAGSYIASYLHTETV